MEAGPAQPIIIDCGSGMTKVGLGGETMPRGVIPTLIGTPKMTTGMPLMGGKKEYIGDEAMSKKGILKLEYPIENGVINNWDSVTSILSHLYFNELRTAPEDYPVLITDPEKDPKVNKEKIAQILFEKFKVPAIFLVNPGILSLYASAITTGTAIDCGECLTLCVPGDQGMADSKAMRKKIFGGRLLTNYMIRMLQDKTTIFQSTGEQYGVKLIKEKVCYVALDPKEVEKKPEPFSYDLPDGNKLTLDHERYQCPEALFTPNPIVAKVSESLQVFIKESIMQCDPSLHKALFSNVVLAGGSTLFPGMKERLEKELNAIAPEGCTAEVKAPKNRAYSAWLGGSVISSLSTFKNMWLTKQEYKEGGNAILATKFPV